MEQREIRSVVIAGGGTAGWMAAAAIARVMGPRLTITLVESSEIGIVGVGEATIPAIAQFNKMVKLDEDDFLRQTKGTIKLGIEFVDWWKKGEAYMHAFGPVGRDLAYIPFHHYFLKEWGSRDAESSVSLWDYSLNRVAAKQSRFERLTQVPGTPLAGLTWAFHFDASLYAAYLSRLAQGAGVRRVDAKIAGVLQHADGDVRALKLEDGREIEGELFIDCTGFRGLLIEQTLKSGYEDWNQWLPCDRAVAVQTESTGGPVPYTRAIAHDAGWRWHIPLQHRVGTGWVYSSAHMSDDEATARLLKDAAATPIRDPWRVPFRSGRRLKAWNKNVVSLGLASGFIEPLESTSLHLSMTSIIRLVESFPFDGIPDSLVEIYNDTGRREMEHVRDFIILHYHANQRDEAMWKQCREMEIPDSLSIRIRAWRDRAHAWQGANELFRVDSWTHVMLGQGYVPQQHHPLTRALPDDQMRRFFDQIRKPIDEAVAKFPAQQEFIDRYCKAAPEVWGARRPTVQA
jgi:tryptophan halogenase